MKDIIIYVDSESATAKSYNYFLGHFNQNLQNKLKFEMTKKINGIAWLEYQKGDNKYYALMEEYEKGYEIDIKSTLLTDKIVQMNLRITVEENPKGIPVFVSNIVVFNVENTINALEQEVEEYPSWIENANEKIIEINNKLKEVDDSETLRNLNVENAINEICDLTDLYNQNALEKTNDYNNLSSEKLDLFNDNAINKINNFNENVTDKLQLFNKNADNKFQSFNENASDKIENLENIADGISDMTTAIQFATFEIDDDMNLIINHADKLSNTNFIYDVENGFLEVEING